MATIVNVQDPSTSNNLAVDSSGRIGVNNFPSVQTIQGTVNVALFPSVQPVSGAVDVTDRSLRQLGIVTVANGGIGTNTAPAYTVIQDPTSNAHKMAINADGSINVSGSITASNPSVGTDGSAIPTSSTLIGASDGTNLQQLIVESASNRNLRVGLYSGANEATVTGSNALKVDNSGVTQPVSGTVTVQQTTAANLKVDLSGTAANATAIKVDNSGVTQPVSGTVTSNIGTTNGLALDTSVNGVIVAQGSATSGEKGPLMQGAVTTSSPTYVASQTSPISLTTAGAVRIDGSAATQPVSGTVVANAGTNLNTSTLALESGGHLSSIDSHLPTQGQAAMAASLPVVLASNQSNVPANIAQVGGSSIALGQTTMASSFPVAIASNQGAVQVTGAVTANAGTGSFTVTQPTGSNLHTVLDSATDTSTSAAVVTVNDAVSLAIPGGFSTWTTQILLGTLSGATLVFEGSPDNGTTWYSIQGNQLGTSTVATSTTSASVWRGSSAGLTNFRVRLSAVSSGSGTVAVRLSNGVNSVSVSNATALGQTVMANSAPVAIASDQSVLRAKADYLEIIGTTITQSASASGAIAVAGADLMTQQDVSAYKFGCVQTIGTFSYTLNVQASHDDATWRNVIVWDASATGSSANITGASIFVFPISYRYLRIRCTTFVSNSSGAGTVELYTIPPTTYHAYTQQAGTWTMMPGNTPNTTPWLVSGSNNNATQAANTAGNVVVKASAGLLVGAMITTTGTVGLTVYDNASTNSGTQVLVIPANPTVGTLYPVNGWCKNGITSAGVTNCPGVTFFFS